MEQGCLPVIVALLQKNMDEPALIFCGLVCINYLSFQSKDNLLLFILDYSVCTQLYEGNAFSLIVMCCVL